ncbi:hypothetical protein Tco_1361537 [Tanacetum coccineum]
MSIVQNSSVVDSSNLQTELEHMKERFEKYIIKKENEYAKLWNEWYKKCEECKYDKISYNKAYNDMQQKIERLQAQLGDQKGKSKDTPCVSNTLDPLSQKLENENVELEFQLARKEELKAKSTLLLAIPDEHLLKFYGIKDAKTLWEAIKARFQKLISQLELHGEVISQEDANLKLLRSLPSTWNNIALIMRNKANLDEVSMDDLYKNLKVYEAEIKSQSSSSSNFQNVAFVSSDDTSSTNEAVNTAHDVPAASSKG